MAMKMGRPSQRLVTHAVNLLRSGQARAGALHRLVDNVRNGVIALARYNRFGVVIELVLDCIANFIDGFKLTRRKLQVVDGFLLALEKLDGVPARGGRRNLRAQNALDFGNSLFNDGIELHLRFGHLFCLCGLDGSIHHIFHAAATKRRSRNNRAAELLGQTVDINLVPVFLDQVHHVQSQNHRHAQVQNLTREVQVALKVGRVNQIDNSIGAAIKQVIARNDFFGRIRRERIDARKVGDNDLFVLGVLTLFFFDGNARPVANILVGARQVVEHRRLAAVRVAGKRNANSHCLPFSRLRICQPEISLHKNPQVTSDLLAIANSRS